MAVKTRVHHAATVSDNAATGPSVGVASASPFTTPRRPRGRPRKTADERDDGNRRQELVRAAARLFRTRGYAATSTRDIAVAVGMHSGSPFYHFESKGALLAEVMEQGMRSALQRQAATLQATGQAPPLDRAAGEAAGAPEASLRALIRTHFDILLGPDSDFVPVMLYEWRSLTQRQRAGIATLQHDYEAPWLPLLQALKDARRLSADVHIARLLLLGALNWSVQWYNPRQGASLCELTDAVMSLFIAKAARRAAKEAVRESRNGP